MKIRIPLQRLRASAPTARTAQSVLWMALAATIAMTSIPAVAGPPPRAQVGPVWSSTPKGAFPEPGSSVPAASFTVTAPGNNFFPRPQVATPAASTVPYVQPFVKGQDASSIGAAQFMTIPLYATDAFPRAFPAPPPAAVGPSDRFPEP
jgi:hypothetical protein